VSSSPKFSFRPRTRHGDHHVLSNKETPGPGSYGYESHDKVKFKQGGTHRFGTSGREEPASSVPGPGAYQPKHNAVGESTAVHRKSPNWRFGSEMKMQKLQAQFKDTPGPGQYQPKNDTVGGYDGTVLKLTPQWRFSSSERLSGSVRDTPGPGSYPSERHGSIGEKLASTTAAPQYRFSSSPRMETPRSNAPGPGSYTHSPSGSVGHTPRPQSAPKWGFGTGRRERTLVKDGPGPGAYGDCYTQFGH